ncbi:MAG: response regulator transcription factor [Phycisphaerales bacterium]|nr:response regulator transcription factor [Phycisphaerales bacterium]
MTGDPIKVLFIDDTADTAHLYSRIIDAQADMRSVGTLSSADDLIVEAKRLRPDITVIDLVMPGRNPLDALRELSDVLPESRAIVFSGHDDPRTVDAALSAGAWGLVSKGDDVSAVLRAIRRVARGEVCFPG